MELILILELIMWVEDSIIQLKPNTTLIVIENRLEKLYPIKSMLKLELRLLVCKVDFHSEFKITIARKLVNK